MIIAKNISKSYNGKQIIKNVNLEINTNEITVLFGPSGCGKTTLCRNISLLEKPDTGTLEIFETSYDFSNNKEFQSKPHSKVNFVFQQLFLWPHLTNKENILLAVKELTQKKEELFDQLTNFLNINNILDNYPNQSSLGQKQRVAIARVLILEPAFIFFDEITSALDIVQTKNIIKLIQDLKKQGLGSLIITHDLFFMEKIADNLIFMNEGKIIELGGTNILKHPKTEILKKFLDI